MEKHETVSTVDEKKYVRVKVSDLVVGLGLSATAITILSLALYQSVKNGKLQAETIRELTSKLGLSEETIASLFRQLAEKSKKIISLEKKNKTLASELLRRKSSLGGKTMQQFSKVI